MGISSEKQLALKEKARQIRRHIIAMISCAESGHPGGSLSAADIVACLYFYKLRHNPQQPDWEGRDKFVLSKGHAAPVLYAALSEAGYFPVDYLCTLRQVGSALQGHPDRQSLPGIEMTPGSLGQGLSVSVGMALAARMDKKDTKIFCMIGDGESQEGQIWEAAMAAGHFKLDNLIVLLDHNQLQIDGWVETVKGIEPVGEKWQAFRWNVIGPVNGHAVDEICAALDLATNSTGKPTIIIFDTTKGRGVSFMENVAGFHGKAPNKEETEKALLEL